MRDSGYENLLNFNLLLIVIKADMLKKTITFMIFIIASILQGVAADNAAAILDATAKKIRTSKPIKVNYTLSGSNQAAGSGTLILSGENFVMTSPRMSVWYDGKNQWTYSAADNEVNLTEPTPSELQQVNPFIIINSFRQTYSAKTLSSTKTAIKIQLTAKNQKADIRTATVTINPSTKLPTEIRLTLASGQSAIIIISQAAVGGTLPAETFRFPKAKYPKAEIIDLR